MNDLRLYLGFFRGIFGFPSSGTSVIYDFDTPFTIRSGSGFSALDSDTLTVPTTSYGNGILEFSGPISSLSLNTNGASISFQAMTFGVDDAPPPIVPLPAALWFGIAGIGALGQIGRRRAAGCPPLRRHPAPHCIEAWGTGRRADRRAGRPISLRGTCRARNW